MLTFPSILCRPRIGSTAVVHKHMADDRPTVLFIEPLYGGSHKQLIDLLVDELPGDLFTLPASKWHWRMRTSALHFSLTVPHKDSYRWVPG